jgi:hypothetical protein
MVNLHTKNPNLGLFLSDLEWKMLVYFISFAIYYCHLVNVLAIWYILWPFGTFYGHLVHFMAIWYILWSFGTFYGHLVHFMAIWYIFYIIVQNNLAALLHKNAVRAVNRMTFT